jgi:hypothetical protein
MNKEWKPEVMKPLPTLAALEREVVAGYLPGNRDIWPVQFRPVAIDAPK